MHITCHIRKTRVRQTFQTYYLTQTGVRQTRLGNIVKCLIFDAIYELVETSGTEEEMDTRNA